MAIQCSIQVLMYAVMSRYMRFLRIHGNVVGRMFTMSTAYNVAKLSRQLSQ